MPTASPTVLRPCDLVGIDDVATAYDVAVDEQASGGGSAIEGDLEWKYDTCSWETEGAIEVRLAVAVGEDFPGGTLLCPPLDYLGTPGTPVDGLPADAWWVESGFNEEEGTLRICTDTHTIDIDADRPSGSVPLDVLRDQTITLADQVLTALG